jgi:hypothetical protein
MTQQKTPIKLSGEDLMFLTEAVFAMSSGLGTKESRAKFTTNKEKVKRLVELHDKYPNDVIEEAMHRLRDVVFSQGEDDGQE